MPLYAEMDVCGLARCIHRGIRHHLVQKGPIKNAGRGNGVMAHQDLGHDISEATETYGGFIALFKWGAIVCIAVTALVLYLIS